jgi:hypothetical protein
MAEAFRVCGLIALCCLLLPLSGWWAAARLRDDSLFRFTVACLAGVTTLAVAELLVYALRYPQWVAAAMVAAAILAGLRPITGVIRRREFAWDALLIWSGGSAILVSATLRYAVHGVPNAQWDWYEHWLRALIFLQQGPATTDIGPFLIAARGPLFNGAAALLLYISGSAQYWVFQIFANTFNMLVCLPFALLLRTAGGLSRRNALPAAAAVTTLVPYFYWHNTFSWTKDLTAAFVLLGMHEYLLAYRQGNRKKMALALAYMAPGFFCHYLALLWAATLGVHLLLVVPFRQLPVRALIRAGLVWALLIGPWFGGLMLTFGVKKTLGANTTLGRLWVPKDSGGRPIPQYRVMIANLCVDMLPRSVCKPLLPPDSCRAVTVEGTSVVENAETCPSGLTWMSIYGILRYSGLLALLLAAAVSAKPLFRHLRNTSPRGAGTGDTAWFLLWVLTAGFAINVLAVRYFCTWGTLGQSLQAWVLILLAVGVRGLMRAPRAAIAVLVLAMGVEYAGFDVKTIQAQSVVLPLAHNELAFSGPPPLGPLLPVPASSARFHTSKDYWANYLTKVQGGAVYYRDVHPDSFGAVSWMMLAAGMIALAAGASASTGGRRAEAGLAA